MTPDPRPPITHPAFATVAPTGRRPRASLPPRIWRAIIEAYCDGASGRSLAARWGVSDSAIRRRCMMVGCGWTAGDLARWPRVPIPDEEWAAHEAELAEIARTREADRAWEAEHAGMTEAEVIAWLEEEGGPIPVLRLPPEAYAHPEADERRPPGGGPRR